MSKGGTKGKAIAGSKRLGRPPGSTNKGATKGGTKGGTKGKGDLDDSACETVAAGLQAVTDEVVASLQGVTDEVVEAVNVAFDHAVDRFAKLVADVGGLSQVNHITTLKPKLFTFYFMNPVT